MGTIHQVRVRILLDARGTGDERNWIKRARSIIEIKKPRVVALRDGRGYACYKEGAWSNGMTSVLQIEDCRFKSGRFHNMTYTGSSKKKAKVSMVI